MEKEIEKGTTYLDKLCHKFYDEPKGHGERTGYVCRLCGGPLETYYCEERLYLVKCADCGTLALVKTTSPGSATGVTLARPTLTPPNEWVSVEDAMPPEHEPVLCIVDGKPKPNITLEDAYQIGSWNKADGWIIDEYMDWEDADVSWWMSLPAPPDKDNNVLAKTPNEPLTLEQLREMDGEPVWIVDVGPHKWYGPGWAIVDRDNCLVRTVKNWNPVFFERYGERWIAYRRPPEGKEE